MKSVVEKSLPDINQLNAKLKRRRQAHRIALTFVKRLQANASSYEADYFDMVECAGDMAQRLNTRTDAHNATLAILTKLNQLSSNQSKRIARQNQHLTNIAGKADEMLTAPFYSLNYLNESLLQIISWAHQAVNEKVL